MGEQPKCRSVILRVVVAMLGAVIFYFGAILAILVLWDGVLIVEPKPPHLAGVVVEGGGIASWTPRSTLFDSSLAIAAFKADMTPRLRECLDHRSQEDFVRRLHAQHTMPIVSILGMIAGCLLIAQLLVSQQNRPIKGGSV
jgi:hypothetical protein